VTEPEQDPAQPAATPSAAEPTAPRQRDLTRLEHELELMSTNVAAIRRANEATRRFAQIALGMGLAACAVAAWIAAGAIDRHNTTQRMAKDLTEIRAELGRVAADRGRAWKLASAALSGAQEPGDDSMRPQSITGGAELPGVTEAGELEVLRARILAAQTRTEEVAAGLLDWGEETKRFVDKQVAAADLQHRQERAQELRLILDRLSDLEAR
jgi:hypothetical protein